MFSLALLDCIAYLLSDSFNTYPSPVFFPPAELDSAITNAAAALVAHRDQVALLEQERDVALTELESLRVQQTELTAESAAVKEHAKAQLQKAIEKIKALTANADSKGQEAARLQESEVRLTEEISGLK